MFVLLWSTGFVGAKYGLPSAEPFTFLFVRMLITLAALLFIIKLTRAKWPRRKAQILHLGVVGICVHGLYLGGVFSAIYSGLPTSIAAIIVGLQPLLTTGLSAGFLGEKITARTLIGLLLGFIGILLVIGVTDNLSPSTARNYPLSAIIWCIVALIGISVGTLYQKRYCTRVDLLTGTFYQYLATVLMTGALAWQLESNSIIWNTSFVLALLWLVFGLSIGAISLLMYLIRHGESNKVASLFYLVPPLVALESWLLFDEQLTTHVALGMLICIIAVYLVISKPRTA